MKLILMIGAIIVTLALIFYSVAIITEQRKHKVSNFVLFFLTGGLLLDITATICMIIGSSNSPFTLHGFIGYAALAGMLVDNFLIWRFRLSSGAEALVPKATHLYSRYAYIGWVVAYITGSILAMN